MRSFKSHFVIQHVAGSLRIRLAVRVMQNFQHKLVMLLSYCSIELSYKMLFCALSAPRVQQYYH